MLKSISKASNATIRHICQWCLIINTDILWDMFLWGSYFFQLNCSIFYHTILSLSFSLYLSFVWEFQTHGAKIPRNSMPYRVVPVCIYIWQAQSMSIKVFICFSFIKTQGLPNKHISKYISKYKYIISKS